MPSGRSNLCEQSSSHHHPSTPFFLSFHRDLEMGKISKILLKSLFVSSTSAAEYLVTGCNDENLDVSKENELFDRPDSTGTSIIIYFGPLSFLQLSTLRFSDRRV